MLYNKATIKFYLHTNNKRIGKREEKSTDQPSGRRDRVGLNTDLGGGEFARETTRDDDWHGPDKQTGTGIARVARLGRSHLRWWPTITYDKYSSWFFDFTTNVDKRSITLSKIVRISILDEHDRSSSRQRLAINWINPGICQFYWNRVPAAIECLGV